MSDPTDLRQTRRIFDVHHGNFVAIDTVFPGTELCVTVRENGELQVCVL